jgi:hypothetical protein
VVTVELRGGASGKPRRPRPRGLSDRDDKNWMKHTLAWINEDGSVKLDDRPVHEHTLSNDIAYIEPKARVY